MIPQLAEVIEDCVTLLEAGRVDERKADIGGLLRRVQNRMAQAFFKQSKAFLAAYSAYESTYTEAKGDPVGLNTAEDAAAAATFAEMESVLQATIAEAIVKGAGRTVLSAGMELSFTVKHPEAVKYLQQHGAELVKGINATTREYIRTILIQAAEQGWSYGKTALAIKQRYREFAVGVPQRHLRSRAELIAVTEIGNAYEHGTMIAAEDLVAGGLAMEKKWLTVGDDRVEQECRSNQADGWIPLDQEFSSGDQRPLAHPACRCTLQTRRHKKGGRNDR